VTGRSFANFVLAFSSLVRADACGARAFGVTFLGSVLCLSIFSPDTKIDHSLFSSLCTVGRSFVSVFTQSPPMRSLTDNVCTPLLHGRHSLPSAFWLARKRNPPTLALCTVRSGGWGPERISAGRTVDKTAQI